MSLINRFGPSIQRQSQSYRSGVSIVQPSINHLNKKVVRGGFAWLPFIASMVVPEIIRAVIPGRGIHNSIRIPPYYSTGGYQPQSVRGLGMKKPKKATRTLKKKGGAVKSSKKVKSPSKSRILSAIRDELSLGRLGRQGKGLRRL